nr:unnamed protein product [Spirometra erinaceieuropaei]
MYEEPWSSHQELSGFEVTIPLVGETVKQSEGSQSQRMSPSHANEASANLLNSFLLILQGPLPNTIADFWRMVWEQRSSIIVAMTRLEERTRIKCEQYWPAIGHGTRTPMSSAVEGWSNHPQSPTTSTHFSPPHLLQDNPITPHRPSNSLAPLCQAPLATVTHGQITVGLLDVVELAYYTIRTFSLQKAGSQEKREVRQLQFTAWPDHGVPNHPAPLLMFLRRVNSECAPETGPIIVHCSAGVGRTGAYIVLDILLQQMRREHAINVPAAVARLRSQRNFMVQTEDQYAFIYEALVEASLSGNTELPARQLRDHWLKLTAPTGDTVSAADTLENTGMTLEFEQLISQTITSLANTIAHRSPGGLLSYLDRRSASVNQSTSGSFLDPSIAGSSVTELAGAQPVNLLKNRRSDCLPHEANRVKLTPIRGVDGSDYINASYVDSYSSRSAFIATQTPLPECLDDFWRMVWETGSCIIVQLDRRAEDTVPDAPYWPTEEAIRFDYVVVEPVADYGMPAYILRELRITDTRSGQSRTVRLFDASELAGAIARTLDSAQRQPLSSDQWEADGRPTLPPALPPLADWLPLKSAVLKPDFLSGYTRSSSVDNYKNTIFDGHLCQVASRNMIDLIEEVHKTQEQFGLEGPITVHCRYGTGYTGIFLALSIILERMRYEGVADMFQTIKLLWWQRRGLVEFPAEYAFCYATALDELNCQKVSFYYLLGASHRRVIDELERRHFLKTLTAFKFYRSHALKKVYTQLAKYEKLSDHQKTLIPKFPSYMKSIEECIDCNANFINQILANAKSEIFEGDHFLVDQNPTINKVVQNGDPGQRYRFGITSNDMDKVRSTLKQFVRDWSTVGAPERHGSYDPVLREIHAAFRSSDRPTSDIRILVPGAGLGRLAWEIAHCGYTCQGNEWSLFMLLPAHFVLNTCKDLNQYTLYPWVTQSSNNVCRENQLAAITIPDVSPSDLPPNVQFSMVAGDFSEVYTEPDSWDCVTTVFFIDTAHNILDYLETIWKILAPGGYWINFGPLLYHFADVPGQDSIELSYSEVREAAELIGFEILKEEQDLPSTYTQDPKSMLQYHYKCVLAVFRKPVAAQSAPQD